MWQQNYTPIAGSLPWSTLVAGIPIFTMLFLLGILRKPAWMASLVGLSAAALVAGGVYGMPMGQLSAAITYGAAFGLFPIGWVVFSAILLYRITVESGKFELLKNSIGNLTTDRNLQALLIAFAFGAFVEGAAGFGTPVAVAGAMLAGLGFTPFYAAAICLLANTAPVAFGSIAIPITTLAGTTGLPLDRLSAGVGRICAPVSLFVPAYLILVMSGRKGLRSVLPAALLCGVSFAGTQFVVSNFINAQLTDILAALAAMLSLLIWIRFTGARPVSSTPARSNREVALAWAPYGLLVIFVLLWGYPPIQKQLIATNIPIQWPNLHNAIQRMPPVVGKPSPYPAVYQFGWLSASGTACLLAAILSSMVVGMSPAQFAKALGQTARQLALAELTLAAVLALAFLMNYSGATATLGLAFAATGVLFPFFSALLGWLGVFLTGSDTSANALFGTLQVVTANKLGMNAVLMASANSAGGVMGKMISLTSIAVAACATNMKREDESLLFRFTLKHSIFLASMIGLIVVFYAYVMPGWAPCRTAALLLLALPLWAQQFPAIEGSNLREHRVKVPDGHASVLVIGFTHASQNQTKEWSKRLTGQFPVYSIAMMEDVPKLVRGMASHGIKSGVPDDQRERFLLVYHGEKEIKQAAEFSTPDDAYVLVVDKGGAIRWKFHGAVTDAALEQLKAAWGSL